VSSPLDEIAYKLGELSAGQAMLLNRAEKRDDEMKKVVATLGKIETSLTPLAEDVKTMKPDVAHYRSVRRNVVWAGSTVWALAVFGGTTFVNWLSKKIGIA
jgi:anti-sigma factor RsiW